MNKKKLSTLTLPRKKNFASIAGFFTLSDLHSNLFQHALFHVSNLQYTALLLHIQTIPLGNQNSEIFSSYSLKALDILHLTNYAKESFKDWTYSFLLVFSWIFFIILIVLFIFYWIKAFTESQKKILKIQKIFQTIFVLFFMLVFSPFNTILMTPWYYSNETIYLGMVSKNMFALNLSVVILNCLIGLILASLCFSPFQGPFSSRSSNFQLLSFVSKGLVTILMPFMNKNNLEIQVGLSIVLFAFSSGKMSQLYKKRPYHCNNTMKASIIWVSIEASLSFNYFLSLIFSKDILPGNLTTITYLNLILIPIVTKLTLIKLNSDLKRAIGARETGSTSEEALRNLCNLNLISKNLRWALYNNNTRFSIYEAYFLGNIIEHSKICQETNCFCRSLVENEFLSQFKNYRDIRKSLEGYFQKQIVEFLLKSIKDIKENNEIKISLTNLIISGESSNLILALTNLLSISDNEGLFIRIKKEILLQEIQKRIDEQFSHESILQIRGFLDFHIHKANFLEMVFSNTKRYLDFWLFYKQSGFRLSEILKKGIIIEEEADKIDTFWNAHNKNSPEFYQKMKNIYSIYLELIRNAPGRAKKIEIAGSHFPDNFQSNKAINNDQITQDHLFLPETLFLIASISKAKEGRIDYVSENIENLLGYRQDELIGNGINALMTSTFGITHGLILINHIQKGRLPGGKKGKTNLKGYIRTKKGYVVPCSIYLTIFPYVQNHLSYMLIIKILDQDSDFIVLTEDGAVEGYSKDLDKIFDFSSDGFVAYISDICMNIVAVSPHLFSSNMISKGENECEDGEINKFDLSQIETLKKNQKGEEIIWRDLKFNRKKNKSNGLEDLYIYCDLKVDMKIMLGNKFYVLTFTKKFTNQQHNDKSTLSNMNISIDENSYHSIPDELNLFEKGPLDIRLCPIPDKEKTVPDLQEAAHFSKVDLLSPAFVLMTEGTSSPKRIQTEVSQFNFDTQQNLLGKSTSNIKDLILEEKLRKKENFNKKVERKMERQITLKNSKVESNMKKQKFNDVSSSSVTTRELSELEEAVYEVPKGELANYQSLAKKIFSAMCIVILIFLIFFTENKLELIKGNLKILKISSKRIFRLVETKRAAEAIYLYKIGLIENTRFILYNLPSFELLVRNSLISGKDFLNKMNGELRISLNQTEKHLHRNFYQNIFPLIINDSKTYTLYRNTFDAATELVTRANYIIATYSESIKIAEDENLNFIRRNSFNQLLLTSEQISTTVVDDIQLKFVDTSNISMIIMFVILLCGFVLTALFIRKQYSLIKERNKFIHLFLKINDIQIAHILNQVKKFEGYLEHVNTMQTLKCNNYDFSMEFSQKSKATANQVLKIRQKDVIMKGINVKQGIIIVLRVLLYLLFALPFINFHALFLVKENIIRSRLETIVEVNMEMYEAFMMLASFYDYVINNGTTLLRERPIGKEWEILFKRSTRMQTLFLDLLISNEYSENRCDSTSIKALEAVVNGNLCEVLPAQRLQTVCQILGNGIVKKGIQTLNGYYLYTLRAIKDDYDNSGKTFNETKKILSRDDLKTVELIIAQWLYAGYEAIANILESCTIQTIDDAIENFQAIIVLYICLCFFGFFTLSSLLERYIEYDRLGWRKMFRKIPIQVVNSNKLLKNYLLKERKILSQSNPRKE